MFGVVPKTLWQKRIAADADKPDPLGLNSLVVRTGRHTVVIETGIGNKQTPKMREIFGNQERLLESYAAAGVGWTRWTSSSTPICTSTIAAGTRRCTPTAG